jgi:hypothetical protein
MVSKSRFAWAWLALLVVVDLLFPWGMVGATPHFSGAFLFWVLWTLIAIASMFVLFLRWRE